VPSSSKI